MAMSDVPAQRFAAPIFEFADPNGAGSDERVPRRSRHEEHVD